MGKQKTQLELFKADVSWFHIFKELIRSKTWAGLSPAAKALYPVIKAFTNWQDGYSFPSFDTLQEYSGLGSRSSINKAIKELEERGYIQSEKKKGKVTLYKLVERFQVEDSQGRPAASVTFDYLPGMVKDAVAELKNFIARGAEDAGKNDKFQYIHIEHLTLNIAGRDIVQNQNVEQQNNLDIGTQMLKGLRDRLEGRRTPEAKTLELMIEESEKKGEHAKG